eukprot:scaffold17955_cov60-Phaeocystis_antarctica.AAC.2
MQSRSVPAAQLPTCFAGCTGLFRSQSLHSPPNRTLGVGYRWARSVGWATAHGWVGRRAGADLRPT